MSDTINAESHSKGAKAKELESLSTGDELLKMKAGPERLSCAAQG